jgi:hypothetical protein
MIYRLWEAAQKRPTRFAGVFGLAMILGALIHAGITVIPYHKVTTAPTTSYPVSWIKTHDTGCGKKPRMEHGSNAAAL